MGKEEIEALTTEAIEKVEKVLGSIEQEKNLQPYRGLGLVVTWSLIGEWLITALKIIITTTINAIQAASIK
jgi:hypothetical protein